jgi:hypothetical protein
MVFICTTNKEKKIHHANSKNLTTAVITVTNCASQLFTEGAKFMFCGFENRGYPNSWADQYYH